MTSQQLLTVVTLTLVAGAAAMAGCGGSDDPEPASTRPAATTPATMTNTQGAETPARRWKRGYPNSIAVLGHSGSTGEGSDPDQPGVEIRENSWVTGTNPKVRSLYARILERNPAIDGNAFNFAQGGANIDAVAAQADAALTNDPVPELILIQVMDSDMTCPVDRSALRLFRTKLRAVVRKIEREAPFSGIFMMGQFGSVPTYARSLTREERAAQGATGPCEFMSPRGDIVEKEVARLEKAIHAYEGVLERECERVRRCTWDEGAFGNAVDRREYTTPDLNHFSVEGHAKGAALAWQAMRKLGVLPRNG